MSDEIPPKPGLSWWRHPNMPAAIIGASGAIIAALILAFLSPRPEPIKIADGECIVQKADVRALVQEASKQYFVQLRYPNGVDLQNIGKPKYPDVGLVNSQVSALGTTCGVGLLN